MKNFTIQVIKYGLHAIINAASKSESVFVAFTSMFLPSVLPLI